MAKIKSELTKIWSYNAITGYWKLERDCYFERREDWLRIFRGDEPGKVFKASRVRPVTPPMELPK